MLINRLKAKDKFRPVRYFRSIIVFKKNFDSGTEF